MTNHKKLIITFISLIFLGFCQAFANDEDYFKTANDLETQGKYKETISYYNQAIKYQPGYVEAYHHKGVVLGKLGKWQEGIVAYDSAIKYKPDYADAYYNKGVVYHKQNKYQEAIAAYDQAIK